MRFPIHNKSSKLGSFWWTAQFSQSTRILQPCCKEQDLNETCRGSLHQPQVHLMIFPLWGKRFFGSANHMQYHSWSLHIFLAEGAFLILGTNTHALCHEMVVFWAWVQCCVLLLCGLLCGMIATFIDECWLLQALSLTTLVLVAKESYLQYRNVAHFNTASIKLQQYTAIWAGYLQQNSWNLAPLFVWCLEQTSMCDFIWSLSRWLFPIEPVSISHQWGSS